MRLHDFVNPKKPNRSPRRKGNTQSRSARRGLTPVALLLVVVFAAALYLAYIRIIAPMRNPAPGDGEVAVHFIDVGQGDSVLIHTSQGSVLIDGGDIAMGNRVVEYLRNAGVKELAYVIATHPHSDHIGGLITVLDELPVGTLIMPNVVHTTRTFERFLDAIEDNDVPLMEPVVGESFTVGGAVFTIISPNSDRYRELNNYSVSLRMVFGSTAFVFTGDAEALPESEMLRHSLSADVLYVGHHGSSTSTSREFLDSVAPSVAVISLGRGNTYGHPHDEVLDMLDEAGIAIYRTDLHGHIVMVTDGSEISVKYERSY